LTIILDESKSTKKGEYRISHDSTVTNIDGTSPKLNMFALQAEGANDVLLLSASTIDDKIRWIATIDAIITRNRDRLMSAWSPDTH
jgi:hypothetical protein